MTARVETFTAAAREWDDFALAQQGGTHFHRHGWLDVVRRVHGHEVMPLCVRAPDGRLNGVLPLVRVRSLLFGHYLVSMPFVSYGGPLGDDDAIRALVSHAAALADATGAGLLELRSARELPVDLAVSHRKITVVLDLAGDPEKVFAGFKAKLRSQVRRPQKEGVTVRFGADQVAPFYDVFAHHMRDLGTPAQPRSWFEALAAAFPGDAWFACAWHGGKPIAGGCGFRWGGEFEITWASALTAYNAMSPNMALYWGFIERAAQEQLAVFNFGRCTPGSGTHRFKQQWGTRDVPLYWYQQARSAAKTPSPDDSAYSWGPRIWKRLPVGVATALGPRLVRGIP